MKKFSEISPDIWRPVAG